MLVDDGSDGGGARARVRGEDVVYLGSRDGHDRQVGFMMMLYIVGEKQDYCGRANAVKQIIIGADKRGLNFLSARINNFVSFCQLLSALTNILSALTKFMSELTEFMSARTDICQRGQTLTKLFIRADKRFSPLLSALKTICPLVTISALFSRKMTSQKRKSAMD